LFFAHFNLNSSVVVFIIDVLAVEEVHINGSSYPQTKNLLTLI